MSQKKKSKKLSTRNIVIIALVALLAAGGIVWAVLANKKDADANSLDRIKAQGKIVIAMEGNWMPWTYHDATTNELIGFDTEVGKAIAAKLGVAAEFQECPWDSIFAGIDTGRYDIAINGIDWKADRAEALTLSDPYVYDKPVLIIRSDNTEINGFADLRGKTTANTVSSTYAALAESYGATNTPIDSFTDTMNLLIDKRIDATINSAMTLAEYTNENPDAPIKIVAQADNANSVVIAMKKTAANDTLVQEINKALNELRADGTLGELSIKYFGSDLTSAPSAE